MINTLILGDCLEILPKIEDKSIDLILADLPYGTTACKWDSVIPFDSLWTQYKRIVKDNAAIVLTASQPFTSALITSNLKMFKYCWVWDKINATGYLQARRMPMKRHEDICVFFKNGSRYNPQGIEYYGKITRRGNNGDNFMPSGKENFQEFTNFPRSILSFKCESNRMHPTQKPLALFEYLIKTYTNENDLVLDNTMGVGTTCLAALMNKRNFIGIEKEYQYYDIACKRIEHYKVENGLK